MFREQLARLQSTILRRPKSVLAGCLVLVLLALWLGSQVELRTSRRELAPPDDPDQSRWEELLRDYRGSEVIVAAVEAAPGSEKTAAEMREFTDRLAERFTSDPLVDRVFHKIDVEWFLVRGFYMIPPETLRSVLLTAEAEREFLSGLASVADLAELDRKITERLQSGFAESTQVPPEAVSAVSGIHSFLRAQREFLDDTSRAVDRWTELPPLRALARAHAPELSDGYPKTHDGRTLFLVITPRDQDDSLEACRRLLLRMREHAGEVTARLPGFRVAFTGTPVMSVEEMDTVRSDTWVTTAVALVGVTLLTFLVFRWRSHAVLVLLALGVGLVWSLGAVLLELGYLNLITSAFISTLIGVGVAYGIHPVSEYELAGAHTNDPVATTREAYRRTGAAVSAAGLTTAVAFFSILLMRFRGFAELGLVAGVGVLLCLLSAMVCLPALLVVYGGWRHRRDRAPRENEVALDRLWLERMAGRVCNYPRATTLIALALTAVFGVAATGLTFNTNILDLLPRNAESLKYQRKMTLESELSPVFNIVVADDLKSLGAMRDRAESEPSVARFESALSFLPQEADATRRILAPWQDWLDGLQLPDEPKPVDRSSLAGSLVDLEDVLARASDAAFGAGHGELAGRLEDARAAAESCLDVVSAAGASDVEEWDRGQRRLLAWLSEAVSELRRAVRTEPPTADGLPPEIRERFFTRAGRPLGLLYPEGSVFDPRALERYVDASLRISDQAIGFPFMLHKMSLRITQGFYRAVAVGALLVVLILLVDLRNLWHALLAMAPLAMGLVWTMGGMRILGLSFNFANLVAVPLIIGVGIDNGVHVIHRVRLEGKAGMHVVLRHTGRAILIASLTTMIGFGSLSLASHRGLASLGVVLLIGVGACLLTSTVVLPNLLVVLGVVKR